MEAAQQPIFKTGLFDNLRSLVTLVDQLRDVGVQEYIKLPRIAVLGTQSAGKSSLLESVVGIDFLPRGEGVVTRRPLEMRLVHKPEIAKPWAVFENNKEEKFFDFDKVRENIVKLTDQIAGTKKGIVNIPIVLTIYSNDCPDLTLIDLPGITRIALRGSDQCEDIEKVTTDMAVSYCQDERTIILCVCPANQDLSTSDALNVARKLDPQGNRTLGVVTKIDIMDRGTDARKMILNQEIELKLGYVGVKNRSQQDINDRMRVQKALKIEEDFFTKHPIYGNLPPDVLGTKALIKKLTDKGNIFVFSIRSSLPDIIKEIDNKVKDCEEKLKELGPSLPRDQKERMHLIWNMLTDYTENFKNQIRGKYDIKMQSKQQSEVSGGARIKLMLNEIYKDQSKANFKATSEYSEDHIVKAITLHQGDSIPGFPSFDSFLYLIIPQLEKLKEPALETLNSVFIYMDSLSNNILKKVFNRFPVILDEISEISSRVLTEERDKAKTVVENLIDQELGYIFTNDVDYLTSKASLVPQQEGQQEKKNQQQQQQQEQDPKKLLAKELRTRVDAYYALVIRNLRDSIPKSIGYFLVRAAQDQMQYQLYSEILRNQQVLSLLDEPEYIAQERDTITTTLKVLKGAQKLLRKDSDFAYTKEQESAIQKIKQTTQEVVQRAKSIFGM